ncbi:MAG: glycosyl transferase family 1, partial [Proteobacteria bacterium]|nr:glycosyl transferase family 1 [Pseudomonadota bacterium]
MLTDIVIISDYAHVTGGSAKVAIESAIGLAERGLRVHFLSAVSPIDERLQAADVTVYCLEQRDVLTDPNRFRATLRGL